MKASIADIDWPYAREAERQKRHDVMAHIATFEKACPTAAGVVHLGATSCFVQVGSNEEPFVKRHFPGQRRSDYHTRFSRLHSTTSRRVHCASYALRRTTRADGNGRSYTLSGGFFGHSR